MNYRTQHAANQLWDRYQIDATDEDGRAAFLDIVDGRALLLAWVPRGREKYLVRIQGRATIAVYNPDLAIIVTMLPHHTINGSTRYKYIRQMKRALPAHEGAIARA